MGKGGGSARAPGRDRPRIEKDRQKVILSSKGRLQSRLQTAANGRGDIPPSTGSLDAEVGCAGRVEPLDGMPGT